MSWPKLYEESEENGSTQDEIQELEEIEDEEVEYDPDEAAEKLAILTAGQPWVRDIRPEGDKVVLVVSGNGPDSEKLPYEIDGVPVEVLSKD